MILDDVDRRILHVLAGNGRITNQELADKVGLSPSPCLRRLRRLEDIGVIKGYTVLVDPKAHGWFMSAIATIRLTRQNEDDIEMFERAVQAWPEVSECYLVTGSRDYILKIMASDLPDYERFIKGRIARLKCVASIETSFIMNTIKGRG
ncbi:MAG TPA: Lrp/AsnC family transcriptional regulator [Hyphomicrobiaceae bacterium]|nr:Lrp/AsnC family transcriptional regulator [Hyphomicrobiaceae bacterium]